MGVGASAYAAVVRRPWLTLIAVAPLCAFFLWLSWGARQRYLAFGSAPAERSAAEALREARAGREPWVKLVDGRFDCASSVALGDARHVRVRAPGLGPGDIMLARSEGFACPGEAELLAGQLKAAHPILLERLGESGQFDVGPRGAQVFEIDMAGGPARERINAWGLLAIGLLSLAFGSLGYAIRSAANGLEQGSRGRLPVERLRAALANPPLRWRRSTKLALPGLTLLAAAFFALFVASVRELAHTVPDVLSEPKRWAAARPVPVRGAPAVVINSRSVVHDYLSNVQVSWQSLERGANDTLTSLSYGVVWVPALQGPVEVRADGQGYLTNLGPQLAKPRLLNAAGTALFMSGLAGLAAWAAAKAWRHAARTSASRRLLLERPKQLFVPLREQQVLTHYGVATGHRTYVFEAPSGKRLKETFGAWRRAVFDESGERVLVVMPEGDENAEPVLVADDGYPFVFERPP